MGMLGNYGQGAQSFADSFMKTYLGVQQNQRANQELGMMEQYRQAQMDQMASIESERQRKASMEREALGRQIQLNQDLGSPVYVMPTATTPGGQRPKTLTEQMDVLQQRGGMEGVKLAADFASKPQTMNPIVVKLMDASKDGTINDQGKALLKALGYDLFSAKQGPLTTGVGPDGKPIRIADAPGVIPYEKPDTAETFGEPYDISVGGKKGQGSDGIKGNRAGSRTRHKHDHNPQYADTLHGRG
jgi:hypothetical protein